MNYQRLSSDEIQYIKDHGEEMRSTDIAAWIGCTANAVRYQKKKLGLKDVRYLWTENREKSFMMMVEEGKKPTEIAAAFHISIMNYYTRLSKIRKKYGNEKTLIQDA